MLFDVCLRPWRGRVNDCGRANTSPDSIVHNFEARELPRITGNNRIMEDNSRVTQDNETYNKQRK